MLFRFLWCERNERIAHMSVLSESGRTAWTEPGLSLNRSRLARLARRPWLVLWGPPSYRTRPTVTGVVLIGLSISVGMAAFNSAHNILYLGLSLMLGSLLLSGFMSWVNFHGCRWRLRADVHGRVGESFPIAVELANGKKWLPSYGLVAELAFKDSPERIFLAQGSRLPAGGRLTMPGILHPEERGQQTVLVEALSSRYPFGFLHKSIRRTCARPVVIWPPRVEYSLSVLHRSSSIREGEFHARKGLGSELIDLREYRPGDAMKSVHWKASARQQRLLVRVTAEESSAHYAVVVDTSGPLWTPDLLDRLAAVAGSVAEDLFVAGHLAGAAVNGRHLEIRRVQDVHALLSELALLQAVERAKAPPPSRWTRLEFHPGPRGIQIRCRGEVVGEG